MCSRHNTSQKSHPASWLQCPSLFCAGRRQSWCVVETCNVEPRVPTGWTLPPYHTGSIPLGWTLPPYQFACKPFFRVSPDHLILFLFLEILTTIFWLHLVSILTRLQNDNSWFLQVRTLFVSGLPMDTKPRELYLLFRAYEVQPYIDIYVEC